ncbi:MAG: isoleucine--tRNA ligase [Pseudanabaenaceae cyanobacterium SKYGB_i_bin29]|nr:isoleucine--tRNA ligase [Pseudanabaenaceae cyanobacterium SKYG29]MDW8420516.1 isoleucine--tRNA ligase [Pseudanabaenaceae cyanobacterium SKYGB_i_bin29]
MTTTHDYKDTVNLPQTEFPMRANAVEREPQIQQFWQEHRIYESLASSNPGEKFVLHDGPPYANGSLHMGHALNKILKDIINRYHILRRRKVNYVLGWDCHGLPIELKVLQNIKPEERKKLTPLQIRQKAKEFALSTVAEQAAGFKRWGVWGDYENPYLTLTPEYEAAQIGVFGAMVLKGYIYRGLKPVYWSPSSQTALAEAELEYPEGHTSPSIYVAFPVVKDERGLLPTDKPAYAVIWTTTPWTIPANLAISVNPSLSYSLVAEGERYLILATDLLTSLQQKLERSLAVVCQFVGKDLEGIICRHPLFDRSSPIICGNHVTAESGTGLVHTAPGHGQDDFVVGNKYHLGVLSPVDDYGVFTAEAGQFAGLAVLGDGNRAVIAALQEKGVLLKEEPYVHKYPYDWRTKKPVILRATKQWFASVDGFREQALRAIKGVKWIPPVGENRITAMVQERSDWCISRQRAWGVPIPVFYDKETEEYLLNEETIAHIQNIFRERGSDAWWELSVAELLPEKYRKDADRYRKGTDTMDVWFDSGSSWAAVAKQRPELSYPADLYLEGSDQHRGWFQSSLLTSVAVHDQAPYKAVLTHGFVLDEKGQKMSKSLGNVIDPMVIINGGKDKKQEPAYGADVLRLWVASVDYTSDVPIGKTILAQIADVSRKIRNTARFLLSNLYDFQPQQDSVKYEELEEIDRYLLHVIYTVGQEITHAFDSFQFYRFFQTMQNFCTVDLSSFYLDVAKDRLYIRAPKSRLRRACQTVLAAALELVTKGIAPVLCHTAEDIWQYYPYPTPTKSVFQSGWYEFPSAWCNPELNDRWTKLLHVRGEVNKVLEVARNEKMIGSSLEAKVLLQVQDEGLKAILSSVAEDLRYLFITSQVYLVEEMPPVPHQLTTEELTIGVDHAEGQKCARCWNYSVKVGTFPEHPTLCERCVEALEALQ